MCLQCQFQTFSLRVHELIKQLVFVDSLRNRSNCLSSLSTALLTNSWSLSDHCLKNSIISWPSSEEYNSSHEPNSKMLSQTYLFLLWFLVVISIMILAGSSNPEIHQMQTQSTNNTLDPQQEARSFITRETSVASIPLMFAPQSTATTKNSAQHHQQEYRPNNQPPLQWYGQYQNGAALRQPVNTPQEVQQQTFLNQEDARQLEQYMIQHSRYSDSDDQRPLDLAHINDRTIITKPTNQLNLARQPYRTDRQQQPQHKALAPAVPVLQRSDRLQMVPLDQQVSSTLNSNHHNTDAATTAAQRRGRLDDVVIFNKDGKLNGLKNLIHKHIGNSLPPGCIARAAPSTSSCEDRLIRRLNQDATEGRTVVDVSRRLCCALFWHKDCISQAVVQFCPDSNPAAAELLLGSRNIDLTMSCQRFNRDGCNGGPGRDVPEHSLMVCLLILMSVSISLFTRNNNTFRLAHYNVRVGGVTHGEHLHS